MKKISLQNFLFIFFLFITILIGSFITIIVLQFNNLNKIRNFASEFDKSNFLWTEAQHAQHDFLIKYKDDPVFFQTEQNKYIKRSQIFVTNTKLKLDSINNLSVQFDYSVEDQIQLIGNNLLNVEEIFEQISHLLFLRGSQKTGLIGNCFTLYELSMNSTDDDFLKDLLVRSHISFMNYLHDPNFSYYEDFLDAFTFMNSYLRQQNMSRDTGIIDTVQFLPMNDQYSNEFINYVNEYKQSFSKLVSIDRKLFLNDQANLMNQWTTMNHDISINFTETNNIFKEITLTKENKAQTFFILSGIMLLLSIALIFIIPRIVSRRIKELHEFIEPLKTGKIPDFQFEPRAFSDVIEMSDSLSQIINSLKKSSAFASEIGKGNFSFEFSPASENDDLGNALILLRDNLSKAQKEEQERRKEDKIREWTNTGIAKFSDILRQATKDINELSTVIIKDLVNYLNSNQGGFFVLNEENKDNRFLELTASYAYSKERKKKKIFQTGEGLIGTCAVEKATIYMTEIPEDYISITSGLGGANPRSLLIAPLKHEDIVLGVLEIASFNKFEKYQIEFVEKIAESIASTLSITKINERTAKLLETAKIEAEQRSLKEEELRQNLEELQATQERAAYRESELQNLISLINNVAYIIELDVDGNIITVPDRLYEDYDIDNSQIIGHHLSEFDLNENTSLKEEDFWQKLLKGQEVQYQRKFLMRNNIKWFNDYIIPFIDNSGQIIKFICVSFDITVKVNENEQLQVVTKELKSKEREINQKIIDIEKARQLAENEKKEALELASKLEASEQILKKAYDKNKEQIEKIEFIVKNAEIQSQRFKMLFDKSHDAIQLLSEGKFIDCNDATLNIFGYNTKEEFINLHPSQVSPEIQPDGKKSMEKANEMMMTSINLGSHTFDWVHKRSNGEDFNAKVTLVSFKQNEELYIYALVKDISGLKQENELFYQKIDKLENEIKNKEEEIINLQNEINNLKKN